MSKTFEPLNPRDESAAPQSDLFPDLYAGHRDPMLGNLPDPLEPMSREDALTRPLDEDTRENVALALEDLNLPGMEAAKEGSSGLKPDALEFKGVNWANKDGGASRTFDTDPGFWNVDYDPTGKKGEKLGRTGILAANVFGRQFSREELEKDDEGRRLITLMEKQRTGEHREEGFWSGLTSFSDTSGSYRKALADIPFLGWIVDAGSTIGESVDMSKTMRKMQNGEAVTDHEALAVRRYMLQQQLDSERGIGYNAGSLFHSSVPFMAEMALSSTMIAGAMKAGALIGSFIAPVAGTAVGAAVGAGVGAIGAVVFGGAGRLLTKAGRASLFGTKLANTTLSRYAGRKFAQGFAADAVGDVMREASAASGLTRRELVRQFSPIGRARALEALGREAAVAERGEAAVAKWSADDFVRYAEKASLSRKAVRDRAKFETLNAMVDRYSTVADDVVDANLARHFLVEGDVVNKFNSGLYGVMRNACLKGVTSGKGYLAEQRAVRAGYRNLGEAAKKQLVSEYVDGVIKGAKGEVLPNGFSLVEDSMERVLGGGVHNSYARKVVDSMAENAMRSFDLMYGGEHLYSNMPARFWRTFADGALDGMLRWNTSVFGGVGTLARSEAALGGKMGALKEALKVSFVEAPVRGAMQFATMAPLWPAMSAVTGNGGEFVLRGQLGIQSQALQTGDRDLMDHAKAIALGSGVVEYISENAGRGINIVAGSVAKPVVSRLLPDCTKDFGSWLSRKVAALYGSDALMKDSVRREVAAEASRILGAKLADQARRTGGRAMSVPFNEIETMVANRSAKGLAGLTRALEATGLDQRKLMVQAIARAKDVSTARAGFLYFTAFHMLEHGFTPQKMAQVLERVGYDGILSEMAEERYGGFFQGLLGLNERPSDEGFRGRVSAALEGLFPDRNQLITEAIGFAIPSIMHSSMHGMYAALGRGCVSDARADANGLNFHMSSRPTVSIGGLTASEVNAIRDLDDERRRLLDGEFGTAESNAAAIGSNAANALARRAEIAKGKLNADAADVEDEVQMRTWLQNKAAEIVSLSSTREELDANLLKYNAQTLFGTEGVRAIVAAAHRRGMVDADTEAFYAKGGKYDRLMEDAKKRLADAAKSGSTVDDAARDLTLQLESSAKDTSIVSDATERFSGDAGTVRVNGFSDDMAGDFAMRFARLGDLAWRYKTNLAPQGSWWRRGMMRLVGIVDAVTTGDLALASNNPVQWMMEDAGLPKDTLNSVLSLKERAVEAGRRRVIERLAAGTGADQAKAAGIRETSLSDFSADMLAKFEAEGRADYEESLDAYARQYLAARNVVAISRSDVSKAATAVVNRRYAKEADVGSEDFVRRHTAAGHYEDARRDVIAKVAENTMKGVIAYNTHAGFGNQMTTSTAYSLNRAMQHGTMPEVAAALREVPAFRAMKPVFDLSGGTGLAEDFGGAVGRAGDVSELLTFDPDSGKWTEGQLRKVLNAMRRPYGQASEAEDRREAGKWLRRLSIAASRQAPVSVIRQSDSSEAPVTYSRVADAKTGEPLVVATVFGADGVTEYVTPPCRDYADVARDLSANGYACEMPKVVLMEDVSFSSKDATSMAVFLLGDRRAARAYYERFIDEERFMPPYLRRKDGDWEFDEAAAAKKLREELAAMRTDSYVRTSVMGDGRADSPFRWGYESVSQKLLEERQVPRTTLDTAARTVAGEATYVVHTSGLPLGNTLFVTSDYFSDGDGEALLRSTLSQAIYQSMVDSRIAGGDHPYVMAVYREMTAAFDQAASKLVAELRESDPERADRLQAAVDALPKSAGRDGTSPDRLAAIASAVVFFTCDRGVGSDGNGFLTAPELAYIADEARVSKWTPLFFSVLDEALGGTGFFSDTRSANGLRRIVEAFSPSSAEIVNARTTSLFRNGEKAAPVRFPWIRWSRETGADGSTALSPVVGVHEPEDDFSSTALGTYVDRVADNCRGFAEAFKSEAGETLTPGRMYEMLKRSDMGGGETAAAPKPSVRAAAVNVNGVVHTIPASNHAPLAASVIDDETAFAIARSLRFLNPKVDDSTTAYHGRVAAKESRDDIVRFLETRGMTPQNIDRVVAKAFEAWGADDRAAVDTDDDEARDEVAAQVAEEGNAELAQSEHASRGVVTSKDLMALGRQLSYVFPTEGSNYTAVLLSLADEMSANAQRLEAELGGAKQASDRWEWQLARFLNVLRSPRNGTATAEEAKAERFDDPAVTDALLDQAIYDMHSQGRDTAAFVLSAIRGVNPRGKHRTQVLRLMAYMDQKDAEQLSVTAGADGFSVTSSPLRYGGQANFASVRAVTRGIVLSDVFRTRNPNASAKSRSRELQAVCYAIARLINRNDYSETDFAERYGRNKDKRVIMPANGDGLTGKTAAEFYSLLGKATEDQSKLAAEIRTIVAAGRTPNAAEHERIVRFADLLAQRYESVAKAFEYLFGPDNEVCRALRNRELVASTVQNVEALMEVPQGDERRSVAEAILETTVRDFERTGATKSGRYTICSQLLSDIVMPVIDGSIVAASRMKGSRASVSSARGGLVSTSVAEAGLLQEDLLAAVRSSGFDELYYHTDLRVNLPKGVTVPADAKLEDFVGSKATFSSSSRSTVTRLVEGLYRSMPRSTVKVTGTDSDELAESSNVAAVEPCPRPLEDRIVDRLFSRVKDAKGVTLRERFLSRGRRFADGTRLGTVCAGAKAGETVLDKSHLSMFVYKANLDRFVSGDTRNVRFEIYHGEKPTVLSLNLPDYVARLLYADITERAQYTRNRVTDSVVESLPKNWGSLRPESRKDAYRAMFSVLADMAGCQYITSKRTQVLHSTALPICTFRDYENYVVDGELDRRALFSDVDGTKLYPGAHYSIKVSGYDATENMGMYFHWGQVVEGQRTLQSNRDAVSQKNHVVSRETEMLTKGQAHCIGLGLYRGERRPTSGVMLESQRRNRRKLERILGLADMVLELPTEEQEKDAELMAKREDAMRKVEEFARHSSLFDTDNETQKCGPFAKGCGFKAAKGAPIHAKVGGKDVWVRFRDGKWQGKAEEDGEWADLAFSVRPEHDNSAYPVQFVIPAMMEVLGLEQLKPEEVFDRKAGTGIESEWRDFAGREAAGTLDKSGIFRNLGTDRGDRLGFFRYGDSDYDCEFYTRTAEAQVMANSDAKSRMGHHSPAASNYTRDVVANARRALLADNAHAAVTMSRFMPYAVVKANDDAFERRMLEADSDFGVQFRAHRNSESVRIQYARKRDALMAKMQRAYVMSAHAVLCGSGIKCDLKPRGDGTYDIEYHYSAGVTQYDKDTFQAARPVPDWAREYMTSGRTYSTARLNVDGDPRFRYGWHVVPGALMAQDVGEFLRLNLPETLEANRTKLEYVYRNRQSDGRVHPDMANVTTADIEEAARIATLLSVFANGHKRDNALQEKVRDIVCRAFTDYTGKALADNPSVDLTKTDFSDLFHRGSFDLAAIELGSHKRTPATADSTEPAVFLGGSFFAGDRRPSGNFEAASGYCRVQAPVDFDPETGAPGPTALYILDPAMCHTQGSDTDGDSATATVADGALTPEDTEFMAAAASELLKLSNYYLGAEGGEADPGRRHELLGGMCRDLLDRLYGDRRFRKYFTVTVDADTGVRTIELSDRFNRMIGNVLLNEQGAAYRNLNPQLFDADGNLVDAGLDTDREGNVVEINGASSVGTSPMKCDLPFAETASADAVRVYAEVMGSEPGAGLSWDDAFKGAVNRISGKAKPDLLEPYDNAMYSASAADASGGRGVGVSNQAALEHLVDCATERVRALAPSLYADPERGVVPFVAHYDGICNALFDVVKDLFAPRCGWKRNLINYMTARLVGAAERQYAEGNPPKFDASWFFVELVTYARELHRDATSVPALLDAYHSWNNYEETDSTNGRPTFLGTYAKNRESGVAAAFLDESGLGFVNEKYGIPDLVLHDRGDERLVGEDFLAAFASRVGGICNRVLNLVEKGRDASGFEIRYRSLRSFLASACPAELREAEADRATAVDNVLALGGRIASALTGVSRTDESYRLKADIRTAMQAHVLLGAADGFMERVAAAERLVEDVERLDKLLDYEDAFSPDSAFQRGGRKAAQLAEKIEKSVARGLVDLSVPAVAMQYAQVKARVTDMRQDSVHPVTVATAATGDDLGIRNLLDASEPEAYFRYCRNAGIIRPWKTQRELTWLAAANLIVRDSVGSVGRALENFGYMQHLPGAIRIALGRMTAEELRDLLDSDAGRKVSDVVARLVEEGFTTGAIENEEGAVPDAIQNLFRMLRVDPSTGRIGFAGKLSAADAKAAADGFAALRAYKGRVWDLDVATSRSQKAAHPRLRGYRGAEYPVGTLTGEQLAVLMRIEIARTQKFDSADELDAFSNVGVLFGDEIEEMERWGAAASQSLPLRRLLSLRPLTAKSYDAAGNRLVPGFDLFARTGFDDAAKAREAAETGWSLPVARFASFMGVEAPAGSEYETLANATPFDLIAEMVSVSGHLSEAFDRAGESDPALRASEVQPAPVSSPFMEGKVFSLVPRTRVDGVKFVVRTDGGDLECDTLEDAVNWYVSQIGRDLMSDPAYASVADAPAQAARAAMTRLEYAIADRVAPGGEFDVRGFVDTVVRDTLSSEYGERFQQWLVDADVLGGDTLVDPLSARQVREALRAAATPTAAPKARIAGRVAAPAAKAPSVTLTRMKRSGFLEFVRTSDPEEYRRLSKNPVDGIRAALEKAFGKWSDATGVKVERVSRKTDSGRYVPVNLIRITRKVKDAKGVHNVTTYVSFGDAISMDLASKEYMASMLEAVNSAGEGARMTLADIEAMTEAQRLALANSLNLRVLGESRSRKCLTTDSLLAMTGLIRLSDSADFYTLFHEYFHQALDFFRETEVCTDADMAALTRAFNDNGRFDEEAAADAFARYLLDCEGQPGGKFLREGMGDPDRVFEKMRRTAQAFLAGALAYDSKDVPVFMKMVISGDFSDREMRNLERTTKVQLKAVEDALLGEDFDFGFERNYQSPEANPGLHEARLGVQNAVLGFRAGTTTAKDVAAAAQRYASELAKPENRIVFDGVLSLYEAHDPSVSATVETPVEKLLRDDRVPAVRKVQLFLETALKRFGEGSVAPEFVPVVARLNDVASWGMDEIDPAKVSDAEAAARRIIRQAAEVLGLDFEDWDEVGRTVRLNALGELLVSDARVAELALRLVQEGTKELQASSAENRRAHASAADVVGSALVNVAPHRWGGYAAEQGEVAASLFRRAAEDCRLRAGADADDAGRLLQQAAVLERRADIVARLVDAIARGEDVSRLIPSSRSRGGSLYDYALRYVLDSSARKRLANGQFAYAATESSSLGLDYNGLFVQQALDAAARALAVAAVVRRVARENGVELPAVGGQVQLPENPVNPPPEGVGEPDTTPQIILQSPGSWLASDLHSRFFGGNLRDMMTDSSLHSAVEEPNRLANSVLFAFGANVPIGARANAIEIATSDLGFRDGGMIGTDGRNRHSTVRVAAVRGHLLGLVNRSAETVGSFDFTADDVNMVNLALQAVTGCMNGEPLYTNYDVSLMSVKGVRKLTGTSPLSETWKYTEDGKVFSASKVLERFRGGTGGQTSNLDVLLGRLIEGFGKEALGYRDGHFAADSLYCKVLGAFVKYANSETRDPGSRTNRPVNDAEYQDLVRRELLRLGLCDTSADGRTVLTVPVKLVKDMWEKSRVYRMLVTEGGRTESMLDLERVGRVLAGEAANLYRVAVKSGWLRDREGGALSSAARPGLFFEAGTGFHSLVSESYENARRRFRGKPSADEQMQQRWSALAETIRRHSAPHVRYLKDENGRPVRGADGKKVVESTETFGERKAFDVGDDGYLRNVSTTQIQYLGRMLGLGRRIEGEGLKTFVAEIRSGLYRKENGVGPYGFNIDPEMDMLAFDRLMFDVTTALITQESLGRKTPLTASKEAGGFGLEDRDFADLIEMNRRLGEKLMASAEADETARGTVCTMTDGQAFRTLGLTPTAKTAPQRLQSMAESIVHAERFRGCLAQMLTTVGSDGMPNYIVAPTDAAAQFAPDEFWQATAKFLHNRLAGVVPGLPPYDAGLSGIRNVRAVAEHVAQVVRGSEGRKDVPIRVHALPPDEIGADGLFSAILCRDDDAGEDVSVMNRFSARGFAGGEATGYMRQLFGSLRSPSQWNGWRVLDRMMAYSKAASVGCSAFFAFATRFESPVAAVGLCPSLVGFTGSRKLADLARALGDTKVGKAMGFDRDMPFLQDFLDSITSDDPAIRDWRMLLDMVGIPLSDAVQNPMSDTQGQIDSDIARLTGWLEVNGFRTTAKEVRGALTAVLHNPSEYAFSNVLNGVLMATVAQTMRRLRAECEQAGRPFDPIRELRRNSAYINAEIGGIQKEKYAWLTPGMQRFLRLTMFSYNWTLGAWTAGMGEVVSDMVFGGHYTTPQMRRFALFRWLRMLGFVKVGVPMVTQALIRGVAGAIQSLGIVGDPDDPDDKDPLGIRDMPYLCFFNESKIGALSIDVTPILKLVGRSDTLRDAHLGKGAWPWIGTVAGAAAAPVMGGIGGFLTGGLSGAARGVSANTRIWSTLVGAGIGSIAGKLIPAYSGKANGANTTGRRRYYMHFGKQSDEFWRWFTDAYGQMTSKLSIPMQKTVEAFFGSTNGSNFAKKFDDMTLTDRFLTLSLDPQESAVANFFTAFTPFSAASVAGHPDAGALGMLGPVQMGMSKTLAQKKIKARLQEFAESDGLVDVWSSPRNARELRLLCSDIFDEAKANGLDPKELLTSALGEVATAEYIRLMNCLPKEKGGSFDARGAAKAMRALMRVNRKLLSIKQSLAKKYKAANVDWKDQRNAPLRRAVMDFLRGVRRDPWRDWEGDEIDRFMETEADSRATRQAGKGGDALASFLATDEVPETLFGIPVVSADYTEEDLAFFRANPEAGGYYDIDDETEGIE